MIEKALLRHRAECVEAIKTGKYHITVISAETFSCEYECTVNAIHIKFSTCHTSTIRLC